MSRNIVRITGALVLLALLISPLAALAHEEVTTGNYVIEYGWLNEPPVAGQPNSIVINIGAKPADAEHTTTGTISIVSPTDDSKVQGDSVDVTIKIEGVDEHDAESMHWHLYVDEHTLAMAPLSQTTVTVTGLSNGAHTVKAAIAASDHEDIGEDAHAMITVEGSSATGEPTATGVEPVKDEHDEGINVDVSGLKVEIVYGGQTTTLTLQPLEGGAPGQFAAPFTPEHPGLHTLRLSGKLSGDMGETDVSVEVEPEEVAPAPTQAANVAGSSSGMPTWLLIGGVALAVIVVAAIGYAAMRRR